MVLQVPGHKSINYELWGDFKSHCEPLAWCFTWVKGQKFWQLIESKIEIYPYIICMFFSFFSLQLRKCLDVHFCVIGSQIFLWQEIDKYLSSHYILRNTGIMRLSCHLKPCRLSWMSPRLEHMYRVGQK